MRKYCFIIKTNVSLVRLVILDKNLCVLYNQVVDTNACVEICSNSNKFIVMAIDIRTRKDLSQYVGFSNCLYSKTINFNFEDISPPLPTEVLQFFNLIDAVYGAPITFGELQFVS